VSTLMLTGGGDWERYTFFGACNEPLPNSWKMACRRRAGHGGSHHTWDPRTGTDRGRHPYPFRDAHGRRIEAVVTWGTGSLMHVPMLRGHGAYIAPSRSDRLIISTIQARERMRDKVPA